VVIDFPKLNIIYLKFSTVYTKFSNIHQNFNIKIEFSQNFSPRPCPGKGLTISLRSHRLSRLSPRPPLSQPHAKSSLDPLHCPSSSMLPPPALLDEMVEGVLLRFPPDDPKRLLRAALVCKRWGRIVSDPGFRRRFKELHRTPPMLGFMYNRSESS
jgi:hypothetical protein